MIIESNVVEGEYYVRLFKIVVHFKVCYLKITWCNLQYMSHMRVVMTKKLLRPRTKINK